VSKGVAVVVVRELIVDGGGTDDDEFSLGFVADL